MARKRAKYASEGNDDARGARAKTRRRRARERPALHFVTRACLTFVHDASTTAAASTNERENERVLNARASERIASETVERGTRAKATSGGELTFARGN